MNCRRARKLIYEFVDGLTDESVQLELESHLGECAECERLAASLKRSLELLHAAPVETLDENFSWKVRLGIHRERGAFQESSQGALLRAWNLRYVVSAAAGFAAILLVGWFAVDLGTPSSPTFEPQTRQHAAAGQGSTEATGPEARVPKTGGVGDRSHVDLVSGGAQGERPGQGAAGAIDAVNNPAQFDSLIHAHTVGMDEEMRMKYLERYIDVLQNRLDEYKQKKRP